MTGRSICKEATMSVEEMVEFCIAQGNKLVGAQVYFIIVKIGIVTILILQASILVCCQQSLTEKVLLP